MTDPDYRVELLSQQRYLLHNQDGGDTLKIDTWTGHVWMLVKGNVWYWKPVADNDQEKPKAAS